MSGYIGTQPVPQATQTRDAFTATNNQTSFPTSGYTPEFLDVFLNGVKLAAADYTATNGSDVVLAAGATTGDILEVVSYGTFEVLNPTFDGNVTFTGNASFGDNDKAIFGDGNDLQIYHDTTSGDSIIKEDSASGGFKILGTNIALRNSDSSKAYIIGTDGGAVTVYHNGSAKLATTSTGIDVTGTVNATNALFSGYIDFQTGGVNKGNIYTDASTMIINTQGTNTTLNTNGGNVGIGTSSPAATSSTYKNLQVALGATVIGRTDDTPLYLSSNLSYNSDWKYIANTTATQIRLDTNVKFFTAPAGTAGNTATLSERMRITTDKVQFNVDAKVDADNSHDLGSGGARWKDLYLSGGVYLGGTGSANKLEDYEEGSWTPSLYAVTGGAVTVSASASGKYTKIGRLVHLIFAIVTFTLSGGTSGATINIAGVPFTTQGSGLDSNGSVLGSYNISWSRTDFVALRTYDVSTLGFLVSNNGGSWIWETVSSFTGSNKYVNGTITYMTTA
jgi:hypothetical protein